MNDFHDMSAYPPAYPPADLTEPARQVEVLLGAEQCAVRGYAEVCKKTAGKDHRTYDPSPAILHEEIEHEEFGTIAPATRLDLPRPIF